MLPLVMSNASSADPVGLKIHQVLPSVSNGAYIGAVDAGDYVQKGSLASTVGPYETYDLSLIHVKRGIRKHMEPAEILGNICQFKNHR
jgi:hypothetical protein